MVQLKITADGSHTLVSDQFENETYHSTNGAINESQIVFIETGLKYLVSKGYSTIKILEFGFGTGLNAFLSLIEAEKSHIVIKYTSIEAFPISLDTASQLNYANQLNFPTKDFLKLHECSWGEEKKMNNYFFLNKLHTDFVSFSTEEKFDLIYYDAFSPATQPELWEKLMMQKVFDLLKKVGLVTTYCAKGAFKRTLKESGFEIESLPGPVGKREITRAFKKI